jgi:DNA-binding MarR family transcriptional regulator
MTQNRSFQPLAAELDESVSINPLDRLLGYQLRRASLAMMADLEERLTGIGLRITEASVLLVIEANPDITQSEIGRVLSIQRANMAPLTTQLERCGLIQRAVPNGRAQALRLTKAGVALARKCRECTALNEARFLPEFDEAKRAALIEQIRLVWDK